MSLSTWCGEGVSNGVGTCGVYNQDFFPVQTFTKQKMCKREGFKEPHFHQTNLASNDINPVSIRSNLKPLSFGVFASKGASGMHYEAGQRACVYGEETQALPSAPHCIPTWPWFTTKFHSNFPHCSAFTVDPRRDIYLALLSPFAEGEERVRASYFFPTSPSQPKCNEISIPMW